MFMECALVYQQFISSCINYVSIVFSKDRFITDSCHFFTDDEIELRQVENKQADHADKQLSVSKVCH